MSSAPRPHGPTVILSDVAREAGVSLATASRALNGSVHRTVGADLRDRVIAAAARLGYSVNAHAQATARGTSSLVSLLLGALDDPYFSSIAAGVEDAAHERSLPVSMATLGGAIEDELETLAMVASQRPRAVIVAGTRTNDPEREQRMRERFAALEASGTRVVFIGHGPDDFDGVVLENERGGRELAEALLRLGYRDFAILGGRADALTHAARVTGFRGALEAAGIVVDGMAGENEDSEPGGLRVLHGDLSRDAGYAAMLRLLSADVRPSCVFAVADVVAVGALAAIRDHGLTPGADIAVAGFDDIATLRDVTPGLTTVSLPLREIGRQALDLALAGGSRDAASRHTSVAGTVVVRASTPGHR